MTSLRNQMRYLNPYDLHKLLINDYILKKPGDTTFLKRDKSKDRNDYHVIKEHHRFLWDESKIPESWELQFAKKYYNKLFKEYCIGDLSLYKENKIALRWRTEKEVVIGKGQFICANNKCDEKDALRTWEVNFVYSEENERKNALVKIRLCPNCSKKLNYHSKKREVKRLQKKILKSKSTTVSENTECSAVSNSSQEVEIIEEEEVGTSNKIDIGSPETAESPWDHHKLVELKSREEEMEEYLQDLLL